MCLESWNLNYPIFSYKWTLIAFLEVLAGERTYSHTLDQKMVLLHWGRVCSSTEGASSGGRGAHGAVKEEGDTAWPARSAESTWGHQWGDRCHKCQSPLNKWKLSPVQDGPSSNCSSILLIKICPYHFRVWLFFSWSLGCSREQYIPLHSSLFKLLERLASGSAESWVKGLDICLLVKAAFSIQFYRVCSSSV